MRWIRGLGIILILSAVPVEGKAKPSEDFYADMNQMCMDTNTNSSAVYITSCYQYIRGFLQGALVMENLILKTSKMEFEDRGADFCFPDYKDMHSAVMSLLKAVQEKFDKVDDAIPDNPLGEHLHEVLQSKYGCETTTASHQSAS